MFLGRRSFQTATAMESITRQAGRGVSMCVERRGVGVGKAASVILRGE